jgi:hypothetical protein
MEWKRGSNINDIKKEGSRNNRNRDRDNNRENDIKDNRNNYTSNYSNRNNNYNKNNYNNRENQTINRIKRDAELKREEAKNKEFNKSNFPELANNKIKVEEKMKSDYLERIKITQEEEKGSKILRDEKNWREHVWIGPKTVKLEKFSADKEKQIKEYMNMASNNASAIIVPFRKTYYSRNNTDWYETWEKTFTESEWTNMNNQLEREENEDLNRRMAAGLEILYQKRKSESDTHYYETGELDGFAIAEKEREEYEKWLEEFEKEFEQYEDEEEIMLDDDYDTDN